MSRLLLASVLFMLVVAPLSSAGLYGSSDVYMQDSTSGSTSASTTSSTSASTSSEDHASLSNSDEDFIARVKLKTNLSLTSGDFGDESRGAILRARLSNGAYAYVKILPETASLTAQTRMNASCAERNCTVELKEVGSGTKARLAYDVGADKPVRVFGFIHTNMRVHADVDAETGAIIATHRPWWAVVAVE